MESASADVQPSCAELLTTTIASCHWPLKLAVIAGLAGNYHNDPTLRSSQRCRK